MTFIKSLACTFLMYSRIPMPQVEWNEDNRRYSLALFPLVGAIIGALLVVWTLICNLLDIGKWLYAAVCCLIPIAVTGGIHADGFSDVTDAKSSYAPREKKLEIMSDPHVGSFAVIFTVLYFILQFGLFTEIDGVRAAICGLSSAAAALISLICYRISAYKTFGGITGDTEGHFLQICEISQLGAAVAAGLIASKIQEVL